MYGTPYEPDYPSVVGLITPILLNPEQTTLSLDDFFTDTDNISAVNIGDNNIRAKLSHDKKTVVITVTGEIEPYSLLNVEYNNGTQYDIVLRKSRKVAHRIDFADNKAQYKEVYIAGSFNNWNAKATPLTRNGKNWQAELFVEPGVYQYKVILDGNWVLDPYNPDSADNNIGGFNSVMRVGNNTPDLLPQLFTQSFEGSEVSLMLKSNAMPAGFYVLWQNKALDRRQAVLTRSNELKITLPAEAQQLQRSFLRVFCYNTAGAGNDVFIPLEYGQPINNPAQLTRADKEATILYFLMIDRFANGSTKNDVKVKDERVLPPANYMGGDLQGLCQKLEKGYFDQLGINCLWISPLTQNPLTAYQEYPEPRRWFSGYHGYWPVSNTSVDFRFGSDNDLKKTVDVAHKRNINVILDLVANHVHEEHPIYKMHPDWATPLNLPDGRKNIRLWDEHRLTTWFDTFLPTLDYEKPEVVKYMVDSSLYWLSTFNLDGFRHDATKHIPNVFWQTLTRRIKQEIIVSQKRQGVLQIGETYGSRELIGSYVGSGQMDGQFDFNLFFDARAVFALDNEPFNKLQNSLFESLQYYGYHSLMGNITGNHDMARFISYAGEDLRFDENAKEAGWTRRIEVKNKVGYQKLSLLTAFTATIPGIPVLYYGDEIGMAGGGDPDNRRAMQFDKLSAAQMGVKKNCSTLFTLRRNNMALLYGDLHFLTCNETIWAYSRQYFESAALVVFNKGNTEKTIEIALPTYFMSEKLKANFAHTYKISGRKLSLTLPPYSFEVLTQ